MGTQQQQEGPTDKFRRETFRLLGHEIHDPMSRKLHKLIKRARRTHPERQSELDALAKFGDDLARQLREAKRWS